MEVISKRGLPPALPRTPLVFILMLHHFSGAAGPSYKTTLTLAQNHELERSDWCLPGYDWELY